MKTLLACVLVEGTHRYFLASLQSLVTFLATPIQGILALLKHFCQGNIQHKKHNFSENNGNFYLFQSILSDRTFHRHIFCDEIWKDWRGPRGKNQVELELPALLTGLH